MSSHHFVREGQEPALVIVGNPDVDVVSGLLEWAPLVMVCEDAIETVISWGFKIDVAIVAEKTSEYWKNQLADQSPISILSSPESQNLELAMQYLIAKKQHTAAIATDQAESILGEFTRFQNDINCLIYSGGWKWVYLKDGHYKKWLGKGTALRCESVGEPLKTSNLLTNGEGFVVENDGFTSIAGERPFWVAEKID